MEEDQGSKRMSRVGERGGRVDMGDAEAQEE